jgi:hypothetical protein
MEEEEPTQMASKFASTSNYPLNKWACVLFEMSRCFGPRRRTVLKMSFTCVDLLNLITYVNVRFVGKKCCS